MLLAQAIMFHPLQDSAACRGWLFAELRMIFTDSSMHLSQITAFFSAIIFRTKCSFSPQNEQKNSSFEFKFLNI